MRATAPGDAATHLPWLSPSAGSLVALARTPSTCWEQIRFDPGAILLLARFGALESTALGSNLSTSLHDPRIIDGAQRLLETSGGFVDWNSSKVAPLYRAAVRIARFAEVIAQRCDGCDPKNAWIAGFLAPLGWLAIAAIDPSAVAESAAEIHSYSHSLETQRRLWGLDHAAIARRLNRRWRLPRWLAAITGHLDLPVETGVNLGAKADVFQTVQLAVVLAERCDSILRFGDAGSLAGRLANLGLTENDGDAITVTVASQEPPPVVAWESPARHPLLKDVLTLARDCRCVTESPPLTDLEADVDQLQAALREQQVGEEGRLRAAKLNSLAEFAAGAGHEINNPLAVISGQAQYLLTHETDPSRRQALQTIVAQAQRIHLILRDLMNFARPPQPRKERGDAPGLMCDVAESLRDLAEQRRVRLNCGAIDNPVDFYADPRQARVALTCLLRNAIEAAPADGWAGVRLDGVASDKLEVVVEDNGPGPARLQREHLFDPFYSGRPAGRGRGMGLPTAWRLARENGGDVRFVDLPGGPTRFILTLPRLNGNQEANGVASVDHRQAALAGPSPSHEGNGKPVNDPN